MLCGFRAGSWLLAVPPSQPPLRGEKPPLFPASPWQRTAWQPPCHAVCPSPGTGLYATCTVFCDAEELFIIYCTTAIEIYFAIRGGKKKSLWPVCFFCFEGGRRCRRAKGSGAGDRVRYVGLLSWEGGFGSEPCGAEEGGHLLEAGESPVFPW